MTPYSTGREAKVRGHSSTVISGAILLLNTVLFINTPCAADWSTFRADVTRSSVTTEGLSHNLSLQWAYKPLQAPKPAWPMPSEELPRMHSDNAYHVAISQGLVYFGSSVADQVLAIDATSGDVCWSYDVEGPVRFAPTVSGGRVFFGSDDGHVYCLDATDGTLQWKRRGGPSDEKVIGNGRMISLWPVRTGVLVDNGVVYFAAGVFPYEGLYIYALREADGSVVWVNNTIGDRSHELEYGGISPHGYLVASPEILYVPSGRAMPAAFDRSTGKFLFMASPGGKRGGTWALLDNDRLITGVDASGTPNKAAYDARSGKRQEDAFAWFAGTDMAVASGVAYLVSPDGVRAVDRSLYSTAVEQAKKLDAELQTLGRQVAALKKQQAESSQQEGTDGLTRRLKASTKQLQETTAQRAALKNSVYLWRHEGKQFTAVMRAGDMVLGSGQGVVVGWDATTGEEVWRCDVDGSAVGLAAAEGHLVVSTDTGCVYCFGEGVPETAKILDNVRSEDPYPRDELTGVYRDAAVRILDETGASQGYCLVLDCGEGRLAYELARQTELQIVGLEQDPAKLAVARSRLKKTGFWGTRVVVEPWSLETLPDYFANLIVSDRMLRTGETVAAAEERDRVLRPWGGTECLSYHENGVVTWKRKTRGALAGAGQWTQQFADPHNTACSQDELVHGSLGMLWYGEPGPQGTVERHAGAQAPVAQNGRLFIEGENLIRAIDAFNGTLLWQREIPGAVRVLVKADSGNLVASETGLYVAALGKCYRLDPASGQTMRVYDMPGDAQQRRRWGYLSVVGNVLFGSTATAMNQEYGAMLETYVNDGKWRPAGEIPAEFLADYERFRKRYPDPKDLRMAAQRSGYMYGRMTAFPSGGEFTQDRAVTRNMMVSDRVFAADTETGKLLWEYAGQRIANIALVQGDGQIFLTDNAVTAEQKIAAIAQRRKLAQAGVYHERERISEELAEKEQLRAKYVEQKQARAASKRDVRQLNSLISHVDYLIASLKSELFTAENAAGTLSFEDADVRLVVALDAITGVKLWEKVVDLTGCGGEYMGTAYGDGLLLFFGNHGNHDAWRFREGGLKWRRITVLDSQTGDMVWSRPLNYRTRPLIVGDKIIIEPQACYLHTGKLVMREHPITGQAVPWEFLRPGHTCGITAASADGLFYRSACTAFYDITRDSGVTIFGGYRPGCAISLIPACGLLLSPEAAAGCTCSYPIRCSWAMKRKPQRQHPWNIYVTPGALRPVKHLAVNLGAVADMKADDGTVWFAYPNPNTASHTHFPNYGVKLNVTDEILPGMGYFAEDFKNVSIAGTDKPWLFTSGCRGLVRCELPLIDAEAGQPASRYDVRLGFRAIPGDAPGQRVFDVKLQGKTVLENCDIARLAEGTGKAVVRGFDDVSVSSSLVLELVPKQKSPTDANAPLLSFIEVRRNP